MSDRSLRLIKKALNVVVVIISSVTFRVVLMLFVKKAQSLLFRGHFFHLLAPKSADLFLISVFI